MKKLIISITSIIICILIIYLVYIGFFITGTKVISVSNAKLTIPTHTYLKNTKENTINLISLRSTISLNKEISSIKKEYKETICALNTEYYDSQNNITITDYIVENNFIFNKITIKYHKNSPEETKNCRQITNYKDVRFYYGRYQNLNTSMSPYYKYKDEDEKLYQIYTDCPYCLEVKIGNGEYWNLKNSLGASYIDMKLIIDNLDYRAKNNEITKKEYNDNSILYKTTQFSILKCSNKEIYISKNINNNNYCR